MKNERTENNPFAEFGITDREVLEFERKMKYLEQFKKPTKKLELVNEVLFYLSPIVETHDYDISLEYTETSALIYISSEYTLSFFDNTLPLLQKALEKVDVVFIERDCEPDVVVLRLIIKDVFCL